MAISEAISLVPPDPETPSTNHAHSDQGFLPSSPDFDPASTNLDHAVLDELYKLDLKEEGEDDGEHDEVHKLDSIEKVEDDGAGEWQKVDLKTDDEAGKLQKADLKAEEDGATELQKVDLKAEEGGEGVEEEKKSSVSSVSSIFRCFYRFRARFLEHQKCLICAGTIDNGNDFCVPTGALLFSRESLLF
ncbi:hypothetical protein TB2_021276 [Malus domestica]